MPSSEAYEQLRQIALAEFADIVTQADIARLDSGVPRKLRLFVIDGSYADIFVAASGRYSYHWERVAIDSKVLYRHDNAPHVAWKHIATYPKHFHDGSDSHVTESYISADTPQALREFCRFIRSMLRSEAQG